MTECFFKNHLCTSVADRNETICLICDLEEMLPVIKKTEKKCKKLEKKLNGSTASAEEKKRIKEKLKFKRRLLKPYGSKKELTMKICRLKEEKEEIEKRIEDNLLKFVERKEKRECALYSVADVQAVHMLRKLGRQRCFSNDLLRFRLGKKVSTMDQKMIAEASETFGLKLEKTSSYVMKGDGEIMPNTPMDA